MAKSETAVDSTETVAAENAAVVKDQKNGVTRPSANTQTGKVWQICDTIFAGATEDNPITRARVIKTAEAEDINVATAATQYGRWRKYMGLERETPKAVKAAEGETSAKKTKKATKDDKAQVAAPVVEDLDTTVALDPAAPAEPVDQTAPAEQAIATGVDAALADVDSPA